jgi:predicted CxxxxCH...CXXCH cytochrome family protein
MVSHALRSGTPAVFAAALLLAGGCGGQGDPLAKAKTAGSPRSAATALSSGASCTETGTHEKHLNLFACVTCHPSGAAFGFDVPYTFAGGTTTAGGTLVLRTETSPTSCAVACHYPKGAPAKSIAWNTPGPLACTECHTTTALPQDHPPVSPSASRADCQACHLGGGHMDGAINLVAHDPDWVNTTSPAFHASSANSALGTCKSCHGEDLAGGVVNKACAECHDVGLPDGVASWKVNCVMCHGGTNDGSGAPPAATWGNGGDAVRIGAHAKHVAGGAFGPAQDCAVCHVKPADALAAGHVDGGTAEVAFAGIAAPSAPTWNRASATCAVYCHGATLSAGGTNTAPNWTGGPVACGDCHGAPPPAPHPAVSSGLTGCASCHSLTIDSTGTLIAASAGGKHLDGQVQATGGHPGAWMDTASAGFHAYSVNRGIGACQSCHGADLSGGSSGVACGQCHDQGLPAGVASWSVNCTMCHGGVASQTGAPPKATWGFAGDPARGGGTADPLRVGAHTKHLTTTLMAPFDCAPCHVKPANALSAGHVDSESALATLTWSGAAVAGGAVPQWNRSAGTCASTYCHGNYAGTYAYDVWDWGAEELVPMTASYAGNRATPGWTGGPVTCGSCHGNPPAAAGVWHTPYHGSSQAHRECQACHPDAVGANGVGTAITNPSLHINGVVNVTPQWSSACIGCH